MPFDLFCSAGSQPVHEVLIEELADEVLGLGRDHALLIPHFWPLNIELSNIVNHVLNCLSAEWTSSNHEFVSHDAQAPPIDGEVVAGNLEYNLRSNIVRGSNQLHLLLVAAQHCLPPSTSFPSAFLLRLFQFFLHLELRESEISEFEMAILVEY